MLLCRHTRTLPVPSHGEPNGGGCELIERNLAAQEASPSRRKSQSRISPAPAVIVLLLGTPRGGAHKGEPRTDVACACARARGVSHAFNNFTVKILALCGAGILAARL